MRRPIKFVLVPGWCLLYVASPFSNFIQYWASLSNFQDFDTIQKFESNCALFTWLTKYYDVMLWFLLLYLVNKCFLLLPCHCNPLSHEIYNLPPAVHWQQGLGKTDLRIWEREFSMQQIGPIWDTRWSISLTRSNSMYSNQLFKDFLLDKPCASLVWQPVVSLV